MKLSCLSGDRGHFRNSNDKNKKFTRLRGTRLKARSSLIWYFFLCVFCSSRSIYFPQVRACSISPTRHISGCWQLSALLLSPCMLVSWAVTSRTAFVKAGFYTVCVWKWSCLHVNSWKNTLDTCWVWPYFLATHLWLEDQRWKSSAQIRLFIYFIPTLKCFMTSIWHRTNSCSSYLLSVYEAEHEALMDTSLMLRTHCEECLLLAFLPDVPFFDGC